MLDTQEGCVSGCRPLRFNITFSGPDSTRDAVLAIDYEFLRLRSALLAKLIKRSLSSCGGGTPRSHLRAHDIHDIQSLRLWLRTSSRLCRRHRLCLCRRHHSSSGNAGPVLCPGHGVSSVVARTVLLFNPTDPPHTSLRDCCVQHSSRHRAVLLDGDNHGGSPNFCLRDYFSTYGLTDMPQLKALLKPLSGSPHTAFIATPLVAFFSPWVFDLVLLLRLYAVFPIATTPKRTFWAVFAFAVSVKAARLGCGIADVVLWVPNVGPQPYTSLYSPSNSSFVHSSLLKAAATFDLVDHLCVNPFEYARFHQVMESLVPDLSLYASCGSCALVSALCRMLYVQKMQPQVHTSSCNTS
jgi:hypothetical protein